MRSSLRNLIVVTATVVFAVTLSAQRGPGRSIGKVTTIGNLIHIEVDSGVLIPEHLFDLDHRTLRFTPDGNGYRVENVALSWDADFGGTAPAGAVTLKNFKFPFSGQTWDTFSIATGSITFGSAAPPAGRGAAPPAGNRVGGPSGRAGFTMERYASMRTVGNTFINMIAGIAAYVKVGTNATRFFKELPDRAVVTWNLTEPAGGIQAFSWTPMSSRVQAVLHKDGRIELSYNDVNARDGVVGVFPLVPGGADSLGRPAIADLSAAKPSDGPYRLLYEGFHWASIPRAADVTCTVIKALGDKFDFLASYSDFRVDNPEGGTPSTGPRGGDVSGIGTSTRGIENYCSQGRFQWQYAQPVSTAAVQFQEAAPDGRMKDYNYAMSQIGHELGHRWAADASALVNGERIALGPVHWATGVHMPAAFPFSKPVESDAMGGGVWKDNGNGTFTQIDDDYYAPANGWSWLALYLMGLARPEEVPDFFIVRNLQRTAQRDSLGPIYNGTRTNITINDVIAAMGPRQPAFVNAQKAFNTAIVVMTMPGKKPTPELIAGANAIAVRWIDYWSKTTGGRSTMTITPR
jgi:hypothetical protein